jgi:hypothetical protein
MMPPAFPTLRDEVASKSVKVVMRSPILLLLLLPLLIGACHSSDEEIVFEPDPTAVYFQVGEISPEHGDSYLLPLTNPSDIAAAREMIESGESKIVVAEISKVTDPAKQYNVDLNNNRKWSWYVSHFEGFSDFTIEILDGWPTYVEENYDEWVEITKGDNGKGRIGFWNYTIKREVPPAELIHD